MKSYPHLFHKLFCEPLMLHGPVRQTFEATLLSRMGGESSPIPVALIGQPQQTPPPADYRVRKIYQSYGAVDVITIDGVIDKRISDFDMECYGGCDLADVDAALAHSAADPNVTRTILDIHSPGGSVVGVHDTYSRIAALTESREVHAYVNRMACSAGYYLAAPADIIAASPTAIIGSIGVYLALLDASGWYEKQGLKINAMQGGKYKTAGAEWKPLSDEERALFQARTDSLYAQFKAAVTASRQVDDSTMQGQWFDGAQAQQLGLVDEITGATLDEYIISLM